MKIAPAACCLLQEAQVLWYPGLEVLLGWPVRSHSGKEPTHASGGYPHSGGQGCCRFLTSSSGLEQVLVGRKKVVLRLGSAGRYLLDSENSFLGAEMELRALHTPDRCSAPELRGQPCSLPSNILNRRMSASKAFPDSGLGVMLKVCVFHGSVLSLYRC